MSDIKVIKDLEPWEVLKRADEGEPVAFYLLDTYAETGIETWSEMPELMGFNFCKAAYAIIDTTPEVEWDKFDWDVFNQYGGLMVGSVYGAAIIVRPTDCEPTIAESPLYYWPGGEQPVPGNVEVEYEMWGGSKIVIGPASAMRWSKGRFKLTGRVL